MVLSAEDYAKVPRLGCKPDSAAKQREAIWPLFGRVRDALKGLGRLTNTEVFDSVAGAWHDGVKPPFDFAVVTRRRTSGR